MGTPQSQQANEEIHRSDKFNVLVNGSKVPPQAVVSGLCLPKVTEVDGWIDQSRQVLKDTVAAFQKHQDKLTDIVKFNNLSDNERDIIKDDFRKALLLSDTAPLSFF